MVATNAFRDVASEGTVLLGAAVATHTPRTVDVYGAVGLDFAVLDLEHDGPSPFDGEAIAAFVRAAEGAGIDLLVRLPSGSADTHPPRVRAVLDAGVRTVLLPRVETPAEVRAAVRAARFRHDGAAGTRGIGASHATTYGVGVDDGFADRADGETAVGVVVETAAALSNLEGILAVPDLGFVVPGPMDLAGSLGHPTDPDHDEVEAAVVAVEGAATDADVPLGSLFVPPAEAPAFADRGYRFLTLGSEVSAAAEVFGDAVARIGDRDGPDGGS
jgi:2-dehydro-3-deoxyglucarate aldolase